jgi:hypothetical protein
VDIDDVAPEGGGEVHADCEKLCGVRGKNLE